MLLRKTLVIALTATALLAAAQVAWTDRPYQTWTNDEVGYVLQGSPWVRNTTLKLLEPTMEYRPPHSSLDGALTAQQAENQRIAQRQFGTIGSTDTSTVPWGQVERSAPTKARVIYARWLSSRTIRESVARYWQLRGAVNENAASALVSYTPDQFALGLGPLDFVFRQGDDIEGQIAATAEELRRSATLEFLPSKTKVHAAAAEVPSGISLTPAAAIILYFPKQQDGKDVPGARDSRARFKCDYPFKDKKHFIEFEFDLKRMQRDGKLDM